MHPHLPLMTDCSKASWEIGWFSKGSKTACLNIGLRAPVHTCSAGWAPVLVRGAQQVSSGGGTTPWWLRGRACALWRPPPPVAAFSLLWPANSDVGGGLHQQQPERWRVMAAHKHHQKHQQVLHSRQSFHNKSWTNIYTLTLKSFRCMLIIIKSDRSF